MDFSRIANPGVRGLKPYVPGKPEDEVARELGLSKVTKLASNENPLGPSPRAIKTLARAWQSNLARYPDGGAYEFKRAISNHHKVTASQVIVGNGSNDIVELLAQAFLAEGDEAIYCKYSFVAYSIAVKQRNAKAIVVPVKEDFSIDVDAVIASFSEKSKIFFLANPNNPTGAWLSAKDVKRILDAAPESCIVMVDEAYFEYVDDPDYPEVSTWLDDYNNLIVTRTFSKIHGLAGLRAGYGLGQPQVIDLMNRVRQPFNVNTLAQLCAATALEDHEHQAQAKEVNDVGYQRLLTQCDALGLSYTPSVGNFLLVDFREPAQAIFQSLLEQGVIVRPVANYGLPNHLRISIGLEAEMNVLFEALARVLKK